MMRSIFLKNKEENKAPEVTEQVEQVIELTDQDLKTLGQKLLPSMMFTSHTEESIKATLKKAGIVHNLHDEVVTNFFHRISGGTSLPVNGIMVKQLAIYKVSYSGIALCKNYQTTTAQNASRAVLLDIWEVFSNNGNQTVATHDDITTALIKAGYDIAKGKAVKEIRATVTETIKNLAVFGLIAIRVLPNNNGFVTEITDKGLDWLFKNLPKNQRVDHLPEKYKYTAAELEALRAAGAQQITAHTQNKKQLIF